MTLLTQILNGRIVAETETPLDIFKVFETLFKYVHSKDPTSTFITDGYYFGIVDPFCSFIQKL